MKKNKWMAAGAACAVLYEICVFFLTSELLDPQSASVHPALLAGLVLVLGYCVNDACRRYDQADGFVSRKSPVSRWLRTVLFLGLLVIFIAALRIMVVQNYTLFLLNTGGRRTILFFLFLLIGFASVLYFRDYSHVRGRKARIRSLKNETSRYGQRRYTMMAADSGKTAEGNTEVDGFVHGTIHKGDTITLEYPGQKVEKHKILNIHIGESPSLKASDQDVRIVLDVPYDEKHTVEKYTVISDLYEVRQRRDLNQTENPLLEGVIADYAKYARDPGFQGILVYALMYAEFLVPGKMIHGKRAGDIMDPLVNNADVGFPTLSSGQNPDLKILPVFTDWDALSRWRDMMSEPDAVTVTADFPMTVDLMRRGFSGFVINPFGPQAFFLSDAFANSVMRMPGYREEMIRRKEKQEQ